MKNYLTADRVY